jgi:HEAT repeat protein
MKLRSWFLFSALLAGGCASADRTQLRDIDKVARLMKLEDERSLGEGEILTRLSDPNPQIRRRAALALGRIGAPESVGWLVPVLSDRVPLVRAEAAFSLGLIEGQLSSEVVAALLRSFSDPDPEVRGRAAEALARQGITDAAGEIAANLRQNLPTGAAPYHWGEDLEHSQPKMAHPDLRLGMFALAQLGTMNQAWAVLATEDRQPRFLWWPAAWTTTHFAATELVPLLLHYAGSNDPYFRVVGTRGLAHLPRERSEGAIVHLLEDSNEKVRIEAVRAAGRLGLRQTVPRLLQLMAGDTDYPSPSKTWIASGCCWREWTATRNGV